VKWKAYTLLLCGTYIHNIYQILPESAEFCRRYHTTFWCIFSVDSVFYSSLTRSTQSCSFNATYFNIAGGVQVLVTMSDACGRWWSFVGGLEV